MAASVPNLPRGGPRSPGRARRILVGLLGAVAAVGALTFAGPTGHVRSDQQTVGSDPGDFMQVGDTLFFRAGDPLGGVTGLWRSDGTRAGTRLVRSFAWGPSDLTAMGRRLWFFAETAALGRGLWSSDGTPTGTRMVQGFDIDAGRFPHLLIAVDDRLFFYVDACLGNEGIQLWTSDGSPAGTVRLRSFRCRDDLGSETIPGDLVAVGQQAFFSVDTAGSGTELWVSDGTPDGTRLVRDVRPGRKGSDPAHLAALGGTVLFRADDGSHGEELWRSDGTAEGTRMVKDLAPGAADASPEETTRVGRRAFFTTRGATGAALWVTDGTHPGTTLVRRFALRGDQAWIDRLTNVRGRLFFEGWDPVGGREPWVSDGTTAGTHRIKDILPGKHASALDGLMAVGERLFFVAADATHGLELWVSDGTPAGTRLIKDIRPGTESGPCLAEVELRAFRGSVYLDADDGTHGCELWRSDGTRSGTWMVKDIATAS